MTVPDNGNSAVTPCLISGSEPVNGACALLGGSMERMGWPGLPNLPLASGRSLAQLLLTRVSELIDSIEQQL